ncbi:MAG: hypothetical protein E6J47_02455 [Chloroflexi bacterium]|nr:MAG: hypothetical protein E6J47_02455 [Chloroflexota bacterium]
MTLPTASDRTARARSAIYRTRLLVNRTPHFTTRTRREANQALDLLDAQLGLNQVNVPESARAIELLNRAAPSLAFGLLRDADFVERFSAPLRHLGIRGIEQRLDEVPGSVMAVPIPGPIGRRHRDELPTEERTDAEGNPLPPPPGY